MTYVPTDRARVFIFRVSFIINWCSVTLVRFLGDFPSLQGVVSSPFFLETGENCCSIARCRMHSMKLLLQPCMIADDISDSVESWDIFSAYLRRFGLVNRNYAHTSFKWHRSVINSLDRSRNLAIEWRDKKDTCFMCFSEPSEHQLNAIRVTDLFNTT